EVADARRIDEVDLLLVPLRVCEAGRQRVLARDLFFVEIGHGRPVIDLAESIDHAGIGEDGRGELCFPGSAVADDRDVPDGSGVVNLHNGGSPKVSKNESYFAGVTPASASAVSACGRGAQGPGKCRAASASRRVRSRGTSRGGASATVARPHSC